MPVDQAIADWVLLIGEEETKVYVEDDFVQKFCAASGPFSRLMRWPTVQKSKEIPLPDLDKFTSKMEYYFLQGRYDDTPQIYYYVYAPADGEKHKYLDRESNLPWAVALERCHLNLDMYTLGQRYQVSALCQLALRKLTAALPLATRDPAFYKLILAAERAPGDVCRATLQTHVRRTLKVKEMSPADWRDSRAYLDAALEQLRLHRPKGWQQDESAILEYIYGVEGNEKLRGFDPEEKEKKKSRFSFSRLSRSS